MLVAAVALSVAIGCGADEPEGSAGAGEAVQGEAVDTTTTTTTGGSSSRAESTPEASGDSAPPPVETSETTAPEEPRSLADVTVELTPVASAESPTKLVARPGTDRLYLAQQGGQVLVVDPAAGSEAGSEVALDVSAMTASGGERGLLGLAFSPDGATLYVHHSGPDGETRVASYAMAGEAADAGSRTELLEVAQPYPNHNGGEILVDDAGLLWIGLGDGGSGGDPEDRAQDPDVLLGKVLRIDPENPTDGRPYGVPADNPFAGGGGAPEVVITGVRNPWRMRFDPATGDLWIADVGQNEVEEIDRLPADAILGTNLGWSRFEGSQTFDEGREVRNGPALGPVFEMNHADGWCSVSGGPVYRGEAVGDLDGAYLFGDFCKTGLNAIRMGDDGTITETVVLNTEVGQVVSIDIGADGEAYVLSIDGSVLRVDPAA